MMAAKWLCRTLAFSMIAASNVASAAAANPLDLRRQTAVQGDASAGATKATICGGCHGPQ